MQQTTEQQAKIVGGNVFGRYPKVSMEQTFNMIISDNALVPYAGYQVDVEGLAIGVGRGLYSSNRADLMIAVVGADVVKIFQGSSPGLEYAIIGTLVTNSGTVYITENNNNQIVISDNAHLYVYNTVSGAFETSNVSPGFTITFIPGYVSFQNQRVIAIAFDSATGTYSWKLSKASDAKDWSTATFTGLLQSKPDIPQAALPMPGHGNMLFLFGKTVVEQQTDIGGALFPYQRSSSFNIDYGCVNPATIATLETFVAWVGGNESSGVSIMISEGGNVTRISTDGIDFLLANLTAPEDSSGFLFRQDGHLIYQVTFKTDNLSLIYDFNTKSFFTATDENMNYHIAQSVVFFQNKYYFVSFNDNNLYELSSNFTTYNGKSIPRIRILPPLRLATQEYFVLNSLSFTIENGLPNTVTSTTYDPVGNEILITAEDDTFITAEDGTFIAAEQDEDATDDIVNITYSNVVDLSISRDGGMNFGPQYRINMNPVGVRRSKFIFYRLGQANDATAKLDFIGFDRFVVFDGVFRVSK